MALLRARPARCAVDNLPKERRLGGPAARLQQDSHVLPLRHGADPTQKLPSSRVQGEKVSQRRDFKLSWPSGGRSRWPVCWRTCTTCQRRPPMRRHKATWLSQRPHTGLYSRIASVDDAASAPALVDDRCDRDRLEWRGCVGCRGLRRLFAPTRRSLRSAEAVILVRVGLSTLKGTCGRTGHFRIGRWQGRG